MAATDEMSLRTFLALPLGELFEKEVGQFLKQIRSQDHQEIRWVAPSQFHVTLHFFGLTREDEVEIIKSVVAPLAASYPPLDVNLQEIGCFPGPQRPRVIWIGVGGDTNQLVGLQGEVEKDLSKAGFSVESRTFKPHGTLGRVKKEAGHVQLSWDALNFQKTELKTTDRIVLFQSRLSPQGARYEAIETFYLSGKPYPEAA